MARTRTPEPQKLDLQSAIRIAYGISNVAWSETLTKGFCSWVMGVSAMMQLEYRRIHIYSGKGTVVAEIEAVQRGADDSFVWEVQPRGWQYPQNEFIAMMSALQSAVNIATALNSGALVVYR